MVYKYWTQEELDFIKEKSSELTDKELHNEINSNFNTKGRSFASVRKTRQRIGIKKKNGRGVCDIE